MAEQITGRITYANGEPAPRIQVRVFDKDIIGKDDDLTIDVGISDTDGHYTVIYDRTRAIDKLDIQVNLPRSLTDWTPVPRTLGIANPLDRYDPYLQLTYTHYSDPRTQTIQVISATQDITLPEPAPVLGTFVPSRNGFWFLNLFPGTPLPFSIPSLPHISEIPSAYGLCGGMSAAAADFFYAGKIVAQEHEIPAKHTPLYQYLMKRQLDSFSPFGEPILQFMDWMKLDEQSPLGTWHRTADQVAHLKTLFAGGMPAHPIGLVYANPGQPLWENHQVLAIGYHEPSPTTIEIPIYDPNFPMNDQVFIRAERRSVAGSDARGQAIQGNSLHCQRIAIVADTNGNPVEDAKPMRGLFLMPYQPIVPPEDL
jgi:hypothetical protein